MIANRENAAPFPCRITAKVSLPNPVLREVRRKVGPLG